MTPSTVVVVTVVKSTGVAIAIAVTASSVALPVTYCAAVNASSAVAIVANAAFGVYPSNALSFSPAVTASSYAVVAVASAASAASIATARSYCTNRQVKSPVGAPVAVTVTDVSPSELAHVGDNEATTPTVVIVPTGGTGGDCASTTPTRPTPSTATSTETHASAVGEFRCRQRPTETTRRLG